MASVLAPVSRRSLLSGVAAVPAAGLVGRGTPGGTRSAVTTGLRRGALPFVAARPAEALASSVGVVNHFHFGGTVYEQTDRVVQAIGELGVRHIRNRITTTAGTRAGFTELTRMGVKVNGVCGAYGDRQPMSAVLAEVVRTYDDPTATFSAFEGINEPNNNGHTWVEETRTKTRDLFLERNRHGLSAVPIVGPSLARVASHGVEGGSTGGQSRVLGDLTPFIDYGNIHVYPRALPPSADIDEFMGHQRAVCGDLPIMCTEGGYFNAMNYRGGAFPTPEEVAAKYLPQQVMEHWVRGNRRFFVYELLDSPDPSGKDRLSHFGLLGVEQERGAWRPKPQFEALKNFLSILGDRGDAHGVGGMPLGISGPSDLRSALVAKRSGARFVVLWRGVKAYEPATRRVLDTDSHAVTLTFDEPKKVKVFRPSQAREAQAVHRGVQSTKVSVGDELVIVKVRLPPCSRSAAGGPSARVTSGRCLQQERDRPVVGQRHRHVGAEGAALDLRAEPLELPAEGLVERLGHRTRRRGGPARPPALAGVAVQRELADHEDRRTDVGGRPLLAQDPDVPHLAGQPGDLGRAVVVGDPEQHDEAGSVEPADHLSVDLDRGGGGSLHHCAHRPESATMTRCRAPTRC